MKLKIRELCDLFGSALFKESVKFADKALQTSDTFSWSGENLSDRNNSLFI